MVIGAIYCRDLYLKKIYADIKKIKLSNGFTTDYEIKWTRITRGNLVLAIDLIDYFFNNPKLRFRAYVIDKSDLDHDNYSQDHDIWYYKMFYKTLEFIIEQGFETNIYLDIKDTKSGKKMFELKRILNLHSNNSGYGKVLKIQAMQSKQSQLIQLTDLFIGALRYINEDFLSSENKTKVVEHLKTKSGQNLISNSTLSNKKFNIFLWQSSYNKGQCL